MQEAGRKAGRNAGRQTDRYCSCTERQKTDRERQTGRLATYIRHIYRQAGRQASRQAGRKTDRQTDIQTDKQTDRKTDFEILPVLYCTFLLYSKHIYGTECPVLYCGRGGTLEAP